MSFICVLGTHHCMTKASCEAYCFLSWPWNHIVSQEQKWHCFIQNRGHSQPWFILKFFVAQTNYRFIMFYFSFCCHFMFGLFENRITSPIPLDHHKSHYWASHYWPFTGGFWPCSALFLTETARRGEPRWRAAAEPHPGNLWRRRHSIPRSSTCGKGTCIVVIQGNWGIHQQFNGDVAKWIFCETIRFANLDMDFLGQMFHWTNPGNLIGSSSHANNTRTDHLCNQNGTTAQILSHLPDASRWICPRSWYCNVFSLQTSVWTIKNTPYPISLY